MGHLFSAYKKFYLNLFVVKLCVHFCVCVSKSLRKWTQTDTKVTFHPPPTRKLFWSQMKGMAKIRLFYSGDMALILPQLTLIHSPWCTCPAAVSMFAAGFALF